MNPREALLLRIRNQTLQIPDLRPLFADWKGISCRHINPRLELLKGKVATRLRSLGLSDSKRERFEATDFALFVALWWPDAPSEKLETLAYFIIWLFIWDDEVDEPPGSYSGDFDRAQIYRDHTLRFVGRCMGILPGEGDSLPQNKIIRSFEDIGSELRAFYNVDQRQRFYDKTAQFIAATEAEQVIKLKGQVPTLEGYMKLRLRSSAVDIVSAVGEYSMSAQLPLEVMRCGLMQALWDEANMIITIVNDLYSLSKETKHGFVDNIVTLAFSPTNDIQQAVSECVELIRVAKQRFDKAERALLSGTNKDDEIYRQLQGFIEVLKSNCVGNLIWR
ncbi:hypothetical protein AAE478_005353 [Parahypoxylon ruwenzoriense]